MDDERAGPSPFQNAEEFKFREGRRERFRLNPRPLQHSQRACPLSLGISLR
jgi:hypothetical protein